MALNKWGQEEIKYKGWELMQWTGWKPRFGKSVVPPEGAFDKQCSICRKPLLPGQEMNWQQNGDAHFACANPDNIPNYFMGQWLFYKPAYKIEDYKYCYANVPPAGDGLFARGANFDVAAAENVVFADTPEEVKERLKAEGLQKMYALIDELEAEKVLTV